MTRVVSPRVVLAAILTACAGCSGDAGRPDTARACFEAIVASAEAADGHALLRLCEPQERLNRLHAITEVRARLARGDDPSIALGACGLTAEQALTGSETDALAALFAKHTPVAREPSWYRNATVAEQFPDGEGDEGSVRLTLRGADGSLRTLWFVRVDGAFALDLARSW